MFKKEIDGVVIEPKSILSSLKIIKAVCERNNPNCYKCPLANVDGLCLVKDISPDNWEINDTGDVWRALL